MKRVRNASVKKRYVFRYIAASFHLTRNYLVLRRKYYAKNMIYISQIAWSNEQLYNKLKQEQKYNKFVLICEYLTWGLFPKQTSTVFILEEKCFLKLKDLLFVGFHVL